MSITGQLNSDNPGYISLKDFNKAVSDQSKREFDAWRSAGFPEEKRAVTKNGKIVLIDLKHLAYNR